MKKLMITAALFCAVTASYAQTTTSSTDKAKTTKATGQGVNTPNPKSEEKTGVRSDKPNPTDQVAQKSSENDGSNRPGGATHENANDVGRYSDHENANSMLFSREAIATRRKNLTEPDTVVREGSGAAPRNTKNHTGVTGNYRNLATQTSGVPSRE